MPMTTTTKDLIKIRYAQYKALPEEDRNKIREDTIEVAKRMYAIGFGKGRSFETILEKISTAPGTGNLQSSIFEDINVRFDERYDNLSNKGTILRNAIGAIQQVDKSYEDRGQEFNEVFAYLAKAKEKSLKIELENASKSIRGTQISIV